MPENSNRTKYTGGLEKTRTSLVGRIRSLFGGKAALGPEQIEELEEILVQADVGVEYTLKIVDRVRRELAGRDRFTEAELKQVLSSVIADMVDVGRTGRDDQRGPRVVLIVGVNGSGKTTTIGKLASRYRRSGKSVMLVAGDTYRAAAEEQLQVWAERSGSIYHRGSEGADPAAVVHDALTRARSGSVDTVLVDTAGRLHTKKPLMEELAKISRVASKVVEGAPHEVYLVLDATTGQNALIQARTFTASAGVTDLIITKMDGSAKGGILIPITGELGLPVRFVGLGEGIDDLVPFESGAYAQALMG